MPQEAIEQLPFGVLAEILQKDSLCVKSEDHVFDFVARYVDGDTSLVGRAGMS